jgi:hypothetical protein
MRNHCGPSGTRTRDEKPLESQEDKPDRANDGEPIASSLNSPRLPSVALAGDRETVSDEALEAAIVRAVMSGLDGVAKTLAAVLDERRRVRAGNVLRLRPR